MADLNLEALGFSEEKLLDLAAQKIADHFFDIEQLSYRAEQMFERRINAAIPKNINQKIDDLLSAEMEKILREEIVPVNMWGEREGQPTNIRNQIAERARKFWDEKVDKDGKLSTYGGSPRHEHMMRQIVNEEFATAIKQNVVNVVGAMKVAAKAHADKITEEALDKLIAVKVSK